MPPSDSPASSQQLNGRKRPTVKRIVPAIPLALSKPRPSKQARVEAEAETTAEPQNPTDEPESEPALNAAVVVGAQHEQGEQAAVSNGGYQSEAEVDSRSGVEESEVKMKSAAIIQPELKGVSMTSMPIRSVSEVTLEPVAPSTPAEAEQRAESGEASPLSSFNSKDRFDLRQIRTELPPEFIPSTEQRTPGSTVSSQSSRPPHMLPHAHPSHPSVGSIVFGSHDSATSSPAPPLSAGSGFAAPTQPASGPSQQPYFVPPGYGQHASEHHSQRMYNAVQQQSYASRPVRQGHAHPLQAAHFHSHAHAPSRYAPRDMSVTTAPQQANGRMSRSRSGSGTSSGPRRTAMSNESPQSAQFPYSNTRASLPEQRPVFSGPASMHQPAFGVGSTHPNHPDVNANMENAETLRAFMVGQIDQGRFTDCLLEIVDEFQPEPLHYRAHRIVLGRSPTLLNLLESEQISSSALSNAHKVCIGLSGQYLKRDVFIEGIKYLYGSPPLILDYHRLSLSTGEHQSTNVNRMNIALQTIATGAWLKVQPIAIRGVDVASSILHWDTLPTALAFALQGGLSQFWNVDDGSEDRISTSSSDDSLGRSEAATSPTHDPFATQLLQRIINFTVHVFPQNFYLDAAAPQLASPARPTPTSSNHESRPSRSDPRLSQIRFGEVPIEEHQRPSFATTTVSSVLLSLPFAILKCVLEHFDLAARLGPETVASIMRQVVAEREARRLKALKARVSGQAHETTVTQLIQNLTWEEFVEPAPQHRAGFRLARRRREIDTPPSSGACSERNK